MFKAIIKLNKALGATVIPVSVFDGYLRSITTLIEFFVENGKTDALNLIFRSFSEGCKVGIPSGTKSWMTARVVSRILYLSASLIRRLKANAAEKEKIMLITDQVFLIIKDHPKVFAGLDYESINAWECLIEEADRGHLGWMTICLPFIENELERIKKCESEFIYNRTLMKFFRILLKIKDKLIKNHWVISINRNSIDIEDTKDGTISSVQLENVLQKNEVKLLQSFIIRHLRHLY